MSARLLTAEQVADRLQVGRTKVFGLMATGQLRSVKIGRLRRVPEAEIGLFIDRLNEPLADAQSHAPDRHGPNSPRC